MAPCSWRLLRLAVLWAVCAAVSGAPQGEIVGDEARGRRRKAVVPLLLGIVLKASTLVPMSLMVLTFLAVTALFTAKLAFGIVGAVGAHSIWHKTDHGNSEINEIAAGIPPDLQPITRRKIIKKHDWS